MINTKTNEFINQLADLVNNSQLPICNIRLAMSYILSQVSEAEKSAIQQEKVQAEKEQNKDSTQNGNVRSE